MIETIDDFRKRIRNDLKKTVGLHLYTKLYKAIESNNEQSMWELKKIIKKYLYRFE